MEFNLVDRTILLTVGGSWSYGLNTSTSDVDIKGVLIPPLKEYRLGNNCNIEQVDSRQELQVFNNILPAHLMDIVQRDSIASGKTPVAPDGAIYDIKKFFQLALNANPNILEILFVEEEDNLIISALGRELRDNRKIFLSKKVTWAYRGYAFAQLRRIRTHRSWLLNPPTEEPTRQKFGLPPERSLLTQDEQNAFLWVLAQILKDKIGEFQLSRTTKEELEALSIYDQATFGIPDEAWPVIQKITGAPNEFIEIMMKERAYRNARNHWKSYINWKATRNPKRAALEAKCGYDSKQGSHLVRLMIQGREIIEKGTLTVKLPKDQREYVLWIKEGNMKYEDIEDWFSREEKELDKATKDSSLRSEPDRVKADQLLIEMQMKCW